MAFRKTGSPEKVRPIVQDDTEDEEDAEEQEQDAEEQEDGKGG